MAVPTISPSVGIVSIAVVLAGPMAGPYMTIVLCAGIGALWALAAVPSIRGVVWLLTAAALLSIAAVLAYGHASGWIDALLVSGMAAVQVATSLLWRDGVPAPYRSPNQCVKSE